MATKDELAQSLEDLGAQLSKATAEIKAEVENLEAQIAGAEIGTNPRIDDAMASLKAKVQALDDLNVDVPASG